MPHRVLLDVYVPLAVADALRRRGIDVSTAQEEGLSLSDDESLLEQSSAQGRVLVTQDADFLGREKVPATFFRSPARAPPSAVEVGEDLPGFVGQFRLAGGEGSGGGLSGGFRMAARFPLARQADEEVAPGGIGRDR